ncbi:Xaa-Pro aminopeptidase [Legionella massiliensis]|uniref:Xaa-Pro aminopeptidase n=1 Tax=Legionella massiliensis TaxID=1034943 RepID=A0A078KP10_9GAMM|nr:Xaa-Pro aminopeptidase [Legionella massiliensis]CDZ76115.1 Xaa-Pro aminopeptidase [Legionella massiliensis]CEE11853.1 Xaa-Pro aminopeptidase [Legionella massiliensis]
MISQQEYRVRRQKLAASLPADSIAVIAAANELLRNGDAHYRFRQDSDFHYLTGFSEPEALLVIVTGKPERSYLFNRPRNPAEEQWTGRRLGQEEAGQVLGVDEAYPIESLSSRLPELMSGKTAIYYLFGRHPEVEKEIMDALEQVKKQVRRGLKAPEALCDLEPLLSEMRLFKSEAEIRLMRRAAQISVAAHKRAMRACSKSENECQLEAELLYEFTYGGCRAVAYDPIVGGGENACVLHYTANNQPLKKGDLLLIDAGGEYENYAADITRTFPVSGRFSEEQRAIYELVLKSQKAGIALIKPGLAWNEVQKTIVHILTAGLCELGLLQGNVTELIAAEAYKPFYMHNSGHWLGLDVHDAGRYKINGEWRPLEAGMVLTVEPGLYISAGIEGVETRWWNIGVRIEDDILVTQDGHENLTAGLPVEVAEIEALLRG